MVCASAPAASTARAAMSRNDEIFRPHPLGKGVARDCATMRGKNPFAAASAADIEALGRDELLDVAQLHEGEIAANRVLESRRGNCELERVLIREAGEAAVEYAGREG